MPKLADEVPVPTAVSVAPATNMGPVGNAKRGDDTVQALKLYRSGS